MRQTDRHPAGGKREVPRDSGRRCDWPGCDEAGVCRAPVSREDLDSFRWFCQEHARQYNAAWNYFEGMSEDEIEASIRRDTTWNRPTWPLGSRPARQRLADDLGLFGPEPAAEARPPRPRSPWDKALAVLGLSPPVTAASVKARYKVLVKRHHPDANGGSKAAEETFKKISQAYRIVMDGLAP